MIKYYSAGLLIKDSSGLTPLELCNSDLIMFRRIILRENPELNIEEYLELNYSARRMALFLAYAAINADGEPTIWCRIREQRMDLLKQVVSFL